MGSQRIFSASFAILSELCGQRLFACGQQNPLTAKNAKISARRSQSKTMLYRHSLLEATSQGAFSTRFATPSRPLRLKALRLWTAKPFNREERKYKRATIAKQDYAPQTFTTRSDVTGGFLRDLCETLASFAVKSSSPVDTRPFNREEPKTSETAKQDYAPQTFTTRNDVTGGLRDLCEP